MCTKGPGLWTNAAPPPRLLWTLGRACLHAKGLRVVEAVTWVWKTTGGKKTANYAK